MIYEENKIDWKIGDIVIADIDSKDHKMLMVVIGTTEKNGTKEWRTQYLNPIEIVPNCVKREYGDKIPRRLMKRLEEIWLKDKKYLQIQQGLILNNGSG